MFLVTCRPPKRLLESDEIDFYYDGDRKLFPLIPFNVMDRKWSIFVYANFILLCNVLLPCLLWYILEHHSNVSTRELVGISSAALGVSSSCDAPFRMLKLLRYPKFYAPTTSTKWYHLDFTMHLYTVCLLTFAIPLAVAPATSPPLLTFFLFTPAMLVGPVIIYLIFSMLPVHCPFTISSDAAGAPIKPGIFTLCEDVGSVDCRQGLTYRRAMRMRYESSPPFRRLMFELTAFWAVVLSIYIATIAIVATLATFDFAFGYVLGEFFIFMLLGGLGTIVLVNIGRRRELDWWSNQKASS